MPLPISIQRSIYPFPHNKKLHRAISSSNVVIIWGGFSARGWGESWEECSMVYYFCSGKWISKKTSGEAPSPSTFVEKMVVVLNDTMIVINTDKDSMHYLDLTSWTWQRSDPSDSLPFRGRIGMSSWVYKGNIYCFGGQNWNNKNYFNEMFCYNTTRNSWDLISQGGDVPTPRKHALTIINDDTVFLCGGVRDLRQFCGDLYFFDMITCLWKQVHGNWLSSETNACVSSFTNISQSFAVQLGAGGTWLLDLQKAKQLEEPSAIWSQIPTPFQRVFHAAVLEPLSKTLWILGGFDVKTKDFTSEVVKISYKKDKLKDLSLDYIARNFDPNDARLCPDEMPKELKNDIDLHRYKI